jgi:NAD(P)-dependent dehydrogenase (short-subunit alcohol dehydrogenase family)
MGRLAGRAAIITGAGRGIGQGIARKFLEEGARVLIADRDEDRVAESARELSANGEVVPFAGNVTDESTFRGSWTRP